MSAVVLFGAAAFVVLGLLAYTGVWRRWMVSARGYGTYMGFSIFYIGIALITGALAVSVAPANRTLFIFLSAVAAVIMLVAIVGFWWLPNFLLPRWFREWRSTVAPGKGRR